ncbi:hypothetical protein Glove_162g74 [Diversispora epigaea]|uniref:ribonuclease H n=1 Tax=Diversispora epigaea TaxID=1348612 RepID=A0A397IRD5_9GLOM|nr:hypothetical protein Glove_162g74 [Diversispora epigaea]
MALILRGKPITDKQAIYIFNAVVILMLEYSLNDMTLSETECLRITTRFISTIKNKALLAITVPNALIHAKEAYNVGNLWDRQVQMQSSNLINRLNDKGGNITIEEVLANELQYNSCRKGIRKWGLMFLEQLVSHDGKMLLYWHEITNNDQRGPKPGWFKMLENNVIIDVTTRVLAPALQRCLGARYNACDWNIGKRSGDIKWVAIRNPGSTVPIIGKRKKTLTESEFTIQHHMQGTSSQNSSNSVIEKCTGCEHTDKSIISELKSDNICLMKTSAIKSISVNVVKSTILLRPHASKANKLRLRSTGDTISEGLDKIVESTQCLGQDCPQGSPLVIIDNNHRKNKNMFGKYINFWDNEHIQFRLDQIRGDLAGSAEIKIYTDGSLIRGDTSNATTSIMDCGWYAFNEQHRNFRFKGKVEKFISSTRAELFAILTAVYATPKGSRLYIFTDSQAAIDTLSLASVNPRKARKRLKNWTILCAIEEIANAQSLILRLEKAKAHSRITYNEIADTLTKEGCHEPACTPNLQLLSSVNAIGCWNSELIEEPIRNFTKQMGKAKYSIKWQLLNRNMSSISEYKSKNIQWESTWRTTMLSDISHNYTCTQNHFEALKLILHKSQKVKIPQKSKINFGNMYTHNITDNKDTRKRVFNVKMLNNELPSLEKLQDRFPLVYHTNICPRCLLEEETQSHIFTCTKNKIDIYTCRNKLFQLIVNKTTAVSCGDSCKDFKNELINIEDLNIPTKFTTRDLNHLSFIDVILDNKDTRKRVFNVKMLNNELPSLEKLQDRFPLVYHTNICPRCLLEEETQSHIFTCTKNKIDIYTCRNKLFQLIVNKTTAVSCGDSCKDFKNELINIEDLNIPTKFTTRDLNHLSFIDVILGFIPCKLYEVVLQKVITKEIADQVMDEVMNQFKLFIYENIWKERCSLVREWERNVGIGNDRKKQKCHQQTSDTDVLSVKNHGDLIVIIGVGCIK